MKKAAGRRSVALCTAKHKGTSLLVPCSAISLAGTSKIFLRSQSTDAKGPLTTLQAQLLDEATSLDEGTIC